MDEKAIFSYLADKIVEDIRNHNLNPDIALAVSVNPIHDYIRRRLTHDDIDHLVFLIENANPQTKAFAAIMSRPFQDRLKIRDALINLWRGGPPESFIVGFQAIYRLLEYQVVANDNTHDFFEFIQNNWKQWKEKIIASYPEPERIIEGAQSRLNDPNFPSWKKWIYLIEIACSPNINEVREFLEKFNT